MSPRRIKTDIELDRRIHNNHAIALLEDRHAKMMKPDGTSGQYIIAVLTNAGSDKERYTCKRYITDLITKKGYPNAKAAARAIFLNPDNFVNVLGENWLPYCCAKGETRKLRESG